jgi:hypothetical protein
MKEIYRILKPNGLVEIRVPSFNPAINHTMIVFFPSCFDTICHNGSSNHKYKDFFFKKVFFKNQGGDKYSKLFIMFPFLRKCFPFMQSGEYIWKLEKS